MDPAQAQPRALEAPEFVDGLGERALLTDAASGESVELLQLRPELTSVPSFEFALRERTARLANFRQQAFARVRRVDRTPEGLAVVSDHVAGFRLSQMLRIAEERALVVDTNAALCLIRQLLPAVALLHENARDVAHGALGPERLIITPHARLVVAEYVLGGALEQLQLTHDRLWRDYRIPMPPSAGAPRFDHRADVMQVGISSLSLILGRTLHEDELGRINEMLAESTETSAGGARQPLSQGLRGWLARALQLDPRRPFLSVREAQSALDQVLAADSRYVASTVAVEAFISRCVDSIIEGAASVPPLAPVPVVPAPVMPPPPAPVLIVPEIASPVATTETPIVVDAPRTFEIPRVPEPPRAAEPFAVPEMPRTLETPDVDELQRTFARQVAAPLFGDSGAEDEAVPESFAAPKKSGRSRWLRVAVVLVGLGVLAAAGTYGARKYFSAPPSAPVGDTGTLVVQSTPAGVQVVVDGEVHGVTPARITLKAGPHILELRGKGLPRVMPLTMTAGGTLSQFVEFAETAGATTGQLDVRSDPAGAKVFVDGQLAGMAPTIVQNLSPGEHRITLEREGATVQHTVTIEPGMTASLVAPLGAAAAGGPVSGWVAVSAPFAMQVYEDGRLIGSSETDRIMISAGRHVLEIANNSLGYRVTRTVQVLPGKVAAVGIELPNGTANVNAVPWAEVWIDDKRIGETPLGNLSLPIGPHEVVFRHPQFGEKRQAISVTASAPVRVSVDMRK
jgi:PEGA domain-containing protein